MIQPTTRSLPQFVRIAQATKDVCRKYNVPILINDRIDVALAIGADGIHIGQTDMPVDVARKLLPPNAIIGMTCNTKAHVEQAIKDRVDYVGLGPVWSTQTKNVTSPVVGVQGIGELLELLESSPEGRNVKAVSIGTRSRYNAFITSEDGAASSWDQVYQCPSLPPWIRVTLGARVRRIGDRERHRRIQRPLQRRQEDCDCRPGVQDESDCFLLNLPEYVLGRLYRKSRRCSPRRREAALAARPPGV